MEQLTRSAKITVEVIEGSDILGTGHETARHLWNYTRWCLYGYNQKLRRERGDDWERFKRNQAYNRTGEKYPGKFAIAKELKDYWAAKNLSDRCFTPIVKDFDIAMRSWFSNLKNNPKARPPRYADRPRQLTFEVGRNAKPVGEWVYKFTVLGGHIPERHAIVRLRLKPGIKMTQVKLIRVQADGSGTIVYRDEQKPVPGDGVAGIDLGIINTAVVAFQSGESILYSGKAILASDQWYQKRAAKCKPKNWAKGRKQTGQSKRNKQYRLKAGNTRRLAVHNLTRHIIDECVKREVGTIVIGDLKGIREDADHGKSGNQRLHAWPFDEIRRQIEYKAEEVSIVVKAVSERNTSKCCHVCGVVGTRNPRGILKCKGCGIAINSDVNGAFNILNKLYPYLADEIERLEGVLEKYKEASDNETEEKKVKLQGKVNWTIDKLMKFEQLLNKVSPLPSFANGVTGIGVEANFPGLPSPNRAVEIHGQCPSDSGIGKAQSINGQYSQIHPSFVAKFDLRNYSIVQTRCN